MEMKRNIENEWDIDWKNIKIPKYAAIHVRPSLDKQKVTDKLNACWNGAETELEDLNVRMWTKPFKCCELNDFIFDDDFIDDLKEDLLELELNKKYNDLYQFHQSDDLSTVDSPQVELLMEFLTGKCRKFLQDVTGIELTEKVSCTFSQYAYTDHLLCHDDKCEDRRIAFILYFNRGWEERDGGALQLFDTDDSMQPKDVGKSILPDYNKFVFFEVTDISYHQVSEIVTQEKTRVSVNGWFHSAVHCSPKPFVEPPAPRLNPHHHGDKTTLAQFINPPYLERCQADIFNEFVARSEILLVDFLNEDWYNRIAESLRREDTVWEKKGPPNRRCYEVAVPETLGPDVAALVALMRSHAMFDLLQKFTNLDLTKFFAGQKTEGNPQCSFEVQRWKHGAYTLLNDGDKTFDEFGLDAVLYFNHKPHKEMLGGFTTYIARGADEELLTVVPSKNALALTYRDKDTLRFVKYLNHRYNGCFHTVAFSYYE